MKIWLIVRFNGTSAHEHIVSADTSALAAAAIQALYVTGSLMSATELGSAVTV